MTYKKNPSPSLYTDFFSYCAANDLEKVKSLISNDQESIKIFYDYTFAATCSYKNIDVLEYLLSPENRHLFSDVYKTLITAVGEAAKENQLDTVKYLSSLPEFNLVEGFKLVCRNGLVTESDVTNTLQYFIFDLNIQKTPEINEYLQKNPNEIVQNMFNIREVSQELTQELNLPKTDTPNKKTKL